ncbi:MAG: Asp-tRNA(Asn)/Glu-tRNA(Gln) amidotransferase subunit GatC [Legionellales bacterium]|nr:Asp-tRNA(Asn)/Glu-tRNA(Gln) amidotransferase subunit GatC [Legionellales bacterium]
MSSISNETVEKIARLSALAIAPEELSMYATQLSNILTLVEQMNTLDTTGIEPMAHPQATNQRLRNDCVTEPDERKELQSLSAFTEAGLYLVNQVIE